MMMSFIFRCINSGGRVAQFEVFLDQKSSCSVHNVLPVNKTIPPMRQVGHCVNTYIHFSKYGSSSSSLSSEIIVLNVLPVNKTIPPIVHLLAACCPLDARSSILIILLLSLFFFFSRLLQMASIKPVVISTPPHLCADNCSNLVLTMSLQLNGTSSSSANTTGTAFQALQSPSNPAETAALKIARTVVKNLFQKGPSDDKFRTLKTTNPKVASKLLSQPKVVGFLIAVGFTNTGEALTYQGNIDVARLQQEFQGIDSLLRALQPASSSSSSTASSQSNHNKKPYIDPTKGSGKSIKAQMRAKEELKLKAKRAAERQRRKELVKGFAQDKEVRKQPGWQAKLSGANKGAAPSMQGSAEGNANLNAH
jgi:hypothetical protein